VGTMFCSKCGKELPGDAAICPACGGRVAAATPALTIDELVVEAKRVARDLSNAAAQVSKEVLRGAGEARKDPKGTTKRAVRKAAKELESAVDEIDRLIKRL